MGRGVSVCALAFLAGCSLIVDGSGADPEPDAAPELVDCAVTSVATGGAHTCALRADGVLRCWGANAGGQLGDGTLRHSSRATEVALSGATAVAAGREHTCALDENGGAHCWGSNDFGELGDSTGLRRLVPTPVKGGHQFSQLSAGSSVTCGVTTEGAALCWGRNAEGELGNGSDILAAIPTEVALPPSTEVVSLQISAKVACALTADGEVYCWGDNSDGATGNGERGQDDVFTPVQVSLTSAAVAVTVHRHACAILDTGAIECWGRGEEGQLGAGTGDSSVPVAVPGLAGLTPIAISAGSRHTCATFDDGTISCWGENQNGQLAQEDLSLRLAPADGFVAELEGRATALRSGSLHVCSVAADGQLRCWGSSESGQTGDGEPLRVEPSPASLQGVDGLPTAIFAGSRNTCIVTDEARVYCWGINSIGQLGEPSLIPSSRPQEIPVLVGTAAVGIGDSHLCALRGSDVLCWGDGANGRLGQGDRLDRAAPTQLAGAFSALSVGPRNACARNVSGEWHCWGHNSLDQLAIDGQDEVLAPTQMDASLSFDNLAIGDTHGCGIESGSLYCWGNDASGALGSPGGSTPAPRLVDGVTGSYTVVSAGSSFSCATSPTSATSNCWGEGNLGQLGDAGSADSPTPVSISGDPLDLVRSYARTSCGIFGQKAVCWGENRQGQVQLEMPERDSVPSPAQVVAGGPVIDVAVGEEHACALVMESDSDISVVCWGSDRFGVTGSRRALHTIEPIEPAGLCDP